MPDTATTTPSRYRVAEYRLSRNFPILGTIGAEIDVFSDVDPPTPNSRLTAVVSLSGGSSCYERTIRNDEHFVRMKLPVLYEIGLRIAVRDVTTTTTNGIDTGLTFTIAGILEGTLPYPLIWLPEAELSLGSITVNVMYGGHLLAALAAMQLPGYRRDASHDDHNHNGQSGDETIVDEAERLARMAAEERLQAAHHHNDY